MSKSVSISLPKQVIVEGQDERRLFSSLAQHIKVSDVEIQECGGYTNLRPFLKTFISLVGFQHVRSLAIVTDADQSQTNRKRGIRDALSFLNLPVPVEPLKMAHGNGLSVVYLVVPYTEEKGMIEDVCLDAVHDDPAIDCVDGYFECIRETELLGPRKGWMSKARVHAFLASRDRPGLRLGEAAEKGIWPFDSDPFSPIRRLLTML